MGICNSCESTSVAATAKLISLDGVLREFVAPVKASRVLEKVGPACFVCNSDEMEFDELVLAVDVEEDLQPGQLYFALPLSWLGRPLQGEDMAALAVKASVALKRSSGGGKKCGGCCRTVDPLMFCDYERVTGVKSKRKVVDGGGGGSGGLVGEKRVRRRGGGGGCEGSKHARKLSMIVEE